MASPITLCGSLSLHPVALGAAMHNAGYRALGLPFTYVPFEVSEGDLASAIVGMRALRIRGFGVSYPFKQAIMKLVDSVDPQAARIGAVNTVVNEGDKLVGHNTDWIGAVRALEEVKPLAGAKVLLIGAGGAASAIAHGLVERGASITIANRDPEKAKRIARETDAVAVAFEHVAHAGEFDVVVNGTSLGMSDVDPSSPVPEDAFRAGQLVMDIVYKPLETKLIAAARARGATVIHGGRMLLHQAARQFELYTNEKAPLVAMDAAIRTQVV